MRFFASLIVALGIAAHPMVGAHAAQEPERMKLAGTGFSTFYSLPVVIAERRGYFKQEGLDVEASDFQGGSKVLQAVVGGAADFGVGGYDHVLLMAAKGIRIRAVFQFLRLPAITIGITKPWIPKFTSPAQLRGMRIGVSAPGSSTHAVLNAYLERNGIRPDEVSIIGVGGPSAASAAVESGKVDAISYVDPTMALLAAKGEIRLIADTRSTQGAAGVIDGDEPAGVVYASEEYIAKHPATVQKVVNAFARAQAWLARASGEQVADTVPAGYLLNDRAFYVRAFEQFRDAYSYNEPMTEAGVRNALKLTEAILPGISAKPIDLKNTFDNKYLERAIQAIR